MSRRDRYFLIMRDWEAGTTEVRAFVDLKEAVHAYDNAEQEHFKEIMGDNPRLEIVLIGGESEDAVRRAYPHYFTEGTRAERRERLWVELLHRLATKSMAWNAAHSACRLGHGCVSRARPVQPVSVSEAAMRTASAVGLPLRTVP